jgi:hypothetical protein
MPEIAILGATPAMHYRARTYFAELGRFGQKDPALRNRVRHHYLYAENNSGTGRDPSGLDRIDAQQFGNELHLFYVDEPSAWSFVPLPLVGAVNFIIGDRDPVFIGVMRDPDVWNVYIRDKSGAEVPIPLAHVKDEVDSGGTTDDWAEWASDMNRQWGYSGYLQRMRFTEDYQFNTTKYLGVQELKPLLRDMAIAGVTSVTGAAVAWRSAGFIKNVDRVEDAVAVRRFVPAEFADDVARIRAESAARHGLTEASRSIYAARQLPAHAKSITDFGEIARRLEKHHGISERLASARLHAIKEATGRGPADDVLFDLTGNVYDPKNRMWLGSLTEGGAGGIR